jgi:hypothetical protein
MLGHMARTFITLDIEYLSLLLGNISRYLSHATDVA